jgi:hypothetical protein
MQEWIWLLNRQFECKKRDAGHSYQNNKGTQKKCSVWKKFSSDHANLKFKKKEKKYFKMVHCMWAVKSVIFLADFYVVFLRGPVLLIYILIGGKGFRRERYT